MMAHPQLNPSSTNGQEHRPDPEVEVGFGRRRFSAAYKLRILEEADRCTEAGQLGQLLRREGLYSSHLSQWRQQRRAGQVTGLQSQPRGRKADPQAAELSRLQRENERLTARLARAELIIEAQKKLCQLLNLPTSSLDEPR
jgi:transposase-like protein